MFETVKGLFGQLIHYKDGQYAGESWEGIMPDSYNHYDANGSFAGYSDPGVFADHVHHDALGNYVGESYKDEWGMQTHYDTEGYAGSSYDGLVGTHTDLYEDSSLNFDQNDAFDLGDW